MPESLRPMECSIPGFPALHYLLEFAQTHVHWINDAIQQIHPLLPSSLAALNFSHHQGLFQWVISLHQVAKVLQLQLQLQHQSFQWIFSFLYDWLVWSPCCPWDSLKDLLQHHSSKASVLQRSALCIVQLSHLYMTAGKTIALTRRTFVGKVGPIT